MPKTLDEAAREWAAMEPYPCDMCSYDRNCAYITCDSPQYWEEQRQQYIDEHSDESLSQFFERHGIAWK